MEPRDYRGIEGRLQLKKVTHLSFTEFCCAQKAAQSQYIRYKICRLSNLLLPRYYVYHGAERNDVLNKVLFHTFHSICPSHQRISSAADTTYSCFRAI